MTMLDEALKYIAEGFAVFPVGVDKKPLTIHGLKDATQTQAGVKEFWTKWPDAGIAIITEGFIVLDFDSKSGGKESLLKLEADYGKLPDTRVHRTGGGGLHFIYRNPNGTDIRNTVEAGGYKGLDIRANGGYIVVPPSLHPSGRQYLVLKDALIAPAPEWIIGITGKTKVLSTITPGESIIFKETTRNQSLTRLAGSLRRNGMNEEAILVSLLESNKRQCDPPLEATEVARIAKSVTRYEPEIPSSDIDTITTNTNGPGNLYIYNRADTGNDTVATNRHKNDTGNDTTPSRAMSVTLADRVLDWVKGTTAWFMTEELDRELGIRDEAEKHNRRVIMARLKEQGLVEPHSKVNRQWRFINKRLTDIDFRNARRDGTLDIKWPMMIENWVNFFPGNIAVIAGAPNAGKTAFMLNFIWLNQNKYDIHYFCSEMGQDGVELRDRLEKFEGMDISEWKFFAHDQSSNFEDVVVPDCINVIDYLEMTEDLWAVNAHLTAINNKLSTGLAIVAIQKKIGAAYGRGQEFGLEKPKLYLSLDKGLLTIMKGKSWAVKGQDPNGLKVKFAIIDGCKFLMNGEWYWEK